MESAQAGAAQKQAIMLAMGVSSIMEVPRFEDLRCRCCGQPLPRSSGRVPQRAVDPAP